MPASCLSCSFRSVGGDPRQFIRGNIAARLDLTDISGNLSHSRTHAVKRCFRNDNNTHPTHRAYPRIGNSSLNWITISFRRQPGELTGHKHHAVRLPDGQSTITEAYARGVNIVLTLEFLELQARVRWICLEDSLSALGLTLDIRRQITKQTPEIPGGPGLHQSRSVRGSVSPLASSSRASRASRRMTSLFSAKRAFQASSSSIEARICEAIASCYRERATACTLDVCSSQPERMRSGRTRAPVGPQEPILQRTNSGTAASTSGPPLFHRPPQGSNSIQYL